MQARTDSKTQADRNADAFLELNRAREVVKAAKYHVEGAGTTPWLQKALEYYEGVISYEQYQSFLTRLNKNVPSSENYVEDKT